MQNPPPSKEALAVAYLTAQGKKQNEIALILKISQAAVSRLYGSVKDEYIQRKFRNERFSEAEMREIERMASPETLRESLAALAEANGNHGPVVYRVSADGERAVEEFATQAATIIRDLILRARSTIGVAWGNTIWHVSQALRMLPPQKPWRQLPVEFVPLCGDPLMNSVEVFADRTSSRIASELSKTVNGDEAGRPAWLGLVPAFIPRNSFTMEEITVIDRLIDLVPQYGRIFGPRVPIGSDETPAAADLDMILTSVGPAEHPVSFGHSPLLKLEKKENEVLAENIWGDIGGVLVPRLENRKGKEPQPHKLVQELTRHWTGLKMEHLENCSRRAFEQDKGLGGRPGVVLLGVRADRAPVVLEAVRRGLVNHLVVATALETALSELLAKTPYGTPAAVAPAQDGRRSGAAATPPARSAPQRGRVRGQSGTARLPGPRKSGAARY